MGGGGMTETIHFFYLVLMQITKILKPNVAM